MNDGRFFHDAAVVLVVGLVLTPACAQAYIDPGSAGFVITTVLGAAAAAGYLIRGWLATAMSWFRRVGRGASDEQPPDRPTEEDVSSPPSDHERTPTQP